MGNVKRIQVVQKRTLMSQIARGSYNLTKQNLQELAFSAAVESSRSEYFTQKRITKKSAVYLGLEEKPDNLSRPLKRISDRPGGHN